ncbi:MAG: SDR family NAD(P)-dependent oxidoreductase [Bacilli bacterium]|nr:SDR family NAD(P)-dependent oxidoreductase [Bacilli bacterium]
MIKEKKWLDKNVDDVSGKTVLITGGTSGIGLDAAISLSYKGASIIIAARNKEKGEAALAKIASETGNSNNYFYQYDQGDKESIASLVEALKDTKLDVIVLNAGVYYPKPGSCNNEDIPMTTAINTVGTYRLWMGLLKDHKDSRFIFTNSVANGKPEHGDYSQYFKKDNKKRTRQYAASKRAAMNMYSLAIDMGLDCSMTHPGVCGTDIIRDHGPLFRKLGNGFLYIFVHKPPRACLGIVKAAATKDTHLYLVPRGIYGITGYPKAVKLPNKSHKGKESLKTLLDSYL